MSNNQQSRDRYGSSYSDEYHNSYNDRRGGYSSRGEYYRGRGGGSRGGHGRHSGSFENRRYSGYDGSRDNRPGSSSSASTEQHQDQSSVSVNEHEPVEGRSNSYNRDFNSSGYRSGVSSRGDYYKGQRGGSYRGGYRGNYRGGYKQQASQHPYQRSNSYQTTGHASTSQEVRPPRSSSSTPSLQTLHNETAQDPVTSRPSSISSRYFTAPWISILGLDRIKGAELKLLGSEGEAEIKRLRDEREALHKKSLVAQQKLHDLKIKNLPLDFNISVLKAQLARDELNVQITQEKLDSISFL